MTKKLNQRAGFTLLETLIYLALFVIVSIVVSLILLSTTNAFLLAYNRRTAGTDGQNTLVRVVLETRQATSIDVANSVLGANLSTLQLNTTDSGGSPTTVKFFVATSTLFVQTGANTAQALTSSSTKVSKFMATRFSTASSEGINFDLTVIAGSRASSTGTFSGTAVVRGSY